MTFILDEKPLPTASTCNMELRLPTCHGVDYIAFIESLILALKGNNGLGILTGYINHLLIIAAIILWGVGQVIVHVSSSIYFNIEYCEQGCILKSMKHRTDSQTSTDTCLLQVSDTIQSTTRVQFGKKDDVYMWLHVWWKFCFKLGVGYGGTFTGLFGTIWFFEWRVGLYAAYEQISYR